MAKTKAKPIYAVKVYVAVRGGNVQAALASASNVDLEVWNWDNFEEEGTAEAKEKEWEKLGKKLEAIY